MSDMAMFELESVEQMEAARDDFACGHMSQQDAYEYSFLDEGGCETDMLGNAHKRATFPTLENL